MKNLHGKLCIINKLILLKRRLILTHSFNLLSFLFLRECLEEHLNFILINDHINLKQKLFQLFITNIASILNIDHIKPIDNGEILIFGYKFLHLFAIFIVNLC